MKKKYKKCNGFELTFLKFPTIIIESELWAKMSATARTLYPVLLRFSDQHYKSVFPGTIRLLELTGFKSRASLKRARKELVSLGLISIQQGSGRRNSRYYFHFDCFENTISSEGADNRPQRVKQTTPRGISEDLSEGAEYALPRADKNYQKGLHSTPLYNKINISINNQVHEQKNKKNFSNLYSSYKKEQVDAAIQECILADLPVNQKTVQNILNQTNGVQLPVDGKIRNWTILQKYLSSRVSATSLDLIKQSMLDEKNGVFVFHSELPNYLKSLLEKICHHVIFEPRIQKNLNQLQERNLN